MGTKRLYINLQSITRRLCFEVSWGVKRIRLARNTILQDVYMDNLAQYTHKKVNESDTIKPRLERCGADSRKTKLGRVEWNPGTLAGVLANERHCGDVLARKTFTPNFLTHGCF